MSKRSSLQSSRTSVFGGAAVGVFAKRASARRSRTSALILTTDQKPDERVLGSSVSTAYRRAVTNLARQILDEQKSLQAGALEPSPSSSHSLSIGCMTAVKSTVHAARLITRAGRVVAYLQAAVEQTKREEEERRKQLMKKNEDECSVLLAEACEEAATLIAGGGSRSKAFAEVSRVAATIRRTLGRLQELANLAQADAAWLHLELGSLSASTSDRGALVSKSFLAKLYSEIEHMQEVLQHRGVQTTGKRRNALVDHSGGTDIANNAPTQVPIMTEKLFGCAAKMQEDAPEAFSTQVMEGPESNLLGDPTSEDDVQYNVWAGPTDTLLADAMHAEAGQVCQETGSHSSASCNLSRPPSAFSTDSDSIPSSSASLAPQPEKEEESEYSFTPDRTSIDSWSPYLCSHVDEPIDESVPSSQEITTRAAWIESAVPVVEQSEPTRSIPVDWPTHMESLDADGYDYTMESLSAEEWMLLRSTLSWKKSGLSNLRSFYTWHQKEAEVPNQQNRHCESVAEHTGGDALVASSMTLPNILYSTDPLSPRSRSKGASRYASLHSSMSLPRASAPPSPRSSASPSPRASASPSPRASACSSPRASASPSPRNSESSSPRAIASPSLLPSSTELTCVPAIPSQSGTRAFTEKLRQPRPSLQNLLVQTPLLHSPNKLAARRGQAWLPPVAVPVGRS
eukprot:TRINITY_DN10791_c0_g1_i2.p1 TRINITY_DN10791_c0_g1~~TRINITY_DN10791_c0_g1_i2.p1  ORF type:complete len:684 (+),score=95.90 TRINITY_DN10791_c0_g1_i2:61-2112(+)